MSYATVDQLREYLPQVPADPKPPASQPINALLQAILDRANSIVNEALGFEFAAYGEEATAQDVRALGGQWLELPAHQAGSVAEVLAVDGRGTANEATSEVGDWLEEGDGRLYCDSGWSAGQWYRVTAPWGYGAAPASVIEVELELAVNLWRGKDRGMYSDVVGVEGGGAVGYSRALTNLQRQTLENVRAKYLGVVHA